MQSGYWPQLLLLSCFLWGCSGQQDPPNNLAASDFSSKHQAPPAEEPKILQGITKAHNRIRQTVAVPPLIWDNNLAAIAQNWANTCTYSHNPTETSTQLGENIFIIFSPDKNSNIASPEQVVESWADERQCYDYQSNTCTACPYSTMCGHYTQLVWSTSKKVGCGMANCAAGSPNGNGPMQIWVCNYEPPGNWVGQRPY